MIDANICAACGCELPSGVLNGLCPNCLLGEGLASPRNVNVFAATTPQAGEFVPPLSQSLVDHFPQLEILELLGHGGMGAVYKARQKKLDRMVALKVIRPESSEDPAFAERFNREARTLARLNHPHIVAVHDFGEVTLPDSSTASGQRKLYYFLMEYVDGANLRELMHAERLPADQALAIIPQICEALQYAHDEGVVHRDIKPENVLLDQRGRVKIADFGLAKLATSTDQDFTLTGTHQIMGTPRYMAPEQMEGSHKVDHRADIYSLGVVFYEMLTGQIPAGHFDPPSKKVQIDVRLDEVVLRSLAREPERRYQNASEIKSAVEHISAAPAGQVPRAATVKPQIIPPEDEYDYTEAEAEVSGPAVAMIVAGLLSMVGHHIFMRYAFNTPLDREMITFVALPGAILGLGLFVGGIAMKTLRSRAIAQLGVISGFIPAGFGWIITVGISIWANKVLKNVEVKQAFLQRRRERLNLKRKKREESLAPEVLDLPAAEADVSGPAIAMILSGLLIMIGHAWAVGYLILEDVDKQIFWTGAPGVVIGLMMIIGGICLKRLRNREWVVLGAISGMIPMSGGILLSFLVSIWVFDVIEKKNVQLAFADRLKNRSGSWPTVDKGRPHFSRKAIIGACFSVPVLLGLLTALLIAGPTIIAAAQEDNVEMFPKMLFMPVMLAMIPSMICAAITTLLGIVAINDIRHSNGKITGLGLAFIDAVLFPSLLMDGVIVFASVVAAWMTLGTSAREQSFTAWVLGSVAVALTLNAAVLARIWEEIRGRDGAESGKEMSESSGDDVLTKIWNKVAGPRPLSRRILDVFAVVAVLLIVLVYTKFSLQDRVSGLNDAARSESFEVQHGPELLDATLDGNLARVQELLALGVNPNSVKDDSRETPLILAASGGRSDIVAELLNAGANVNVSNRFGMTPLMMAAAQGNAEIVKMLIEAGANLDAQDAMPAGMPYAIHWNTRNAKSMIDWPAARQSALTLAAYRGHLEVIKELVDAGATTNLLDVNQQSVGTIIQNHRDPEFRKAALEWMESKWPSHESDPK